MNAMYVGAALVGMAIFAAVLLVATASHEPTGVAKSLSLIEGSISGAQVVKSELGAKDRLVTPVFGLAGRLAGTLSPSGTAARLTRGLDRAGNPVPWTVERLMGVKGLCLVLGLVLGFFYGGGSLIKSALVGLALAAALFYLPDLLIYNMGVRRQEQVMRGFAESLDMLTVCVEAGQGFDAAIMQVARNTDGPIAGEFSRVVSEIQIGKSRTEAFSALGNRVNLPDLKNFVSAIVQADRLGIPIASVLREQTAAMRLTRKQRAEEKAQKVTVKILFPLLLCIFPCLMIVIIGPGAIRMMQSLFNGSIM